MNGTRSIEFASKCHGSFAGLARTGGVIAWQANCFLIEEGLRLSISVASWLLLSRVSERQGDAAWAFVTKYIGLGLHLLRRR